MVSATQTTNVEAHPDVVHRTGYADPRDTHVLEVALKNGQVWQLFGVRPDIYDALLHATISSFLNFLAHRYRAAPVRTVAPQRDANKAETCPAFISDR